MDTHFRKTLNCGYSFISLVLVLTFLVLSVVAMPLVSHAESNVWAWGDNGYGGLGDGTTTTSKHPVQVNYPTYFTKINAGNRYSAGLLSDGTMWMWGYNGDGELGTGNAPANSLLPVQIPDFNDVVDISLSDRYCLALKSDGTVWRWGDEAVDICTPEFVPGLTDITAIGTGSNFFLAVKSDGTVWAWGVNNYGQLGDGTTTRRDTPELVTGLTDVVDVSAGVWFSAALKSDGTVWTWGRNDVGQLGNNTRINSPVPIQAQGISDVMAISAGASHILALKSDGTLWSWGYNAYGQLGTDDIVNNWLPVQVKDSKGTGYMTGIIGLSAGTFHSMALKSDGTVWTWGKNANGQLGDNTTKNKTLPTEVTLPYPVNSVEAGFNHSLALWKPEYEPPSSAITDPADGATLPLPLSGYSIVPNPLGHYTIRGTAADTGGAGVGLVEVSTDGGYTWDKADGKDSWAYNWIVESEGTYNILTRAIDFAGNLEGEGTGISVNVEDTGSAGYGIEYGPDEAPPVSSVEEPLDGMVVSSALNNFDIFCSADDGAGSGVSTVDISVNGGAWTSLSGSALASTTISTLDEICADSSAAFDQGGYAHISFHDPHTKDLKYATNASGFWVITTIDSEGFVGKYNSLAVDGTNNVHISYYDETNKASKYATNLPGFWTYTTLESAQYTGKSTSLALDSSDNVHITYDKGPDWSIRYATNSHGFWSYTTIINNDGNDAEIAFDSGDNLHIAYHKSNGKLRYGTNLSGFMSVTTIDGSAQVGENCSIAIDNSDKVHISYYDWNNEDIKYATNASGFWSYTTLESDSVRDFGWRGTSLAVDQNSNVHISYDEYSDNEVRYATNAPGFWITTSIATGMQWGNYNSLAVDAGGDAYIVHSAYAGQLSISKFRNNPSSPSFWHGTLSPGGDGSYTIQSQATDLASNVEVAGPGITVLVDNTSPTGSVIAPLEGESISGVSYTITGTGDDGTGSGIREVFVKVCYENPTLLLLQQEVTDTSGAGDWSTWSFDWTLPSDGDLSVKVIMSDYADNSYESPSRINFSVDNSLPTSVITSPADGALLTGTSTTITGTAIDGTSNDITNLEVSLDGGMTWTAVTGSKTSWSFSWDFKTNGDYDILTRATDLAGNVEVPGPGVHVTVFNRSLTSPELVHVSWDSWLTVANCGQCHAVPATFLPADFRQRPVFCRSCHNPSAAAHDRNPSGLAEHGIMMNVTSGSAVYPTYGNITAAEYDNRPSANLYDSDSVVCITCHNPFKKTEDVGRVWEMTTTSDNLTYTMQNGGWSEVGLYVPQVYRDTSLISAPTLVKDRKAYLVDASEYTYNEAAGTITFIQPQDPAAYVYVTLDFPYMRASSYADRLCSDCHTENTHMGANCLVCHSAHNTDNLGGISRVVRATDLTERAVVFTNLTGANSFADGDATYNGICEVCHTSTLYHRNDGSGSANHTGSGLNQAGTDCTSCHSHSSGFAK